MTEAQLVPRRGPIAASDEISRRLCRSIVDTALPPAWLKLFRNAATACVPQATEVAKISTNHRLRRFGANDPA